MTKTQRLLMLMDYIKIKRSFTVQELADEFKVSYRTMWRYLQDLSLMGLPLYSEPGGNGGYRLLEKDKKSPCKIVNVPKSTYAGYHFQAPYTARSETEILVPRLWLKLLSLADNFQYTEKAALVQFQKTHFSYYVTLKVTKIFELPEGMTCLSIPSMNYAKVTHSHSIELEDTISSYEHAYKWIEDRGLKRNDSAFHLEVFDERFNPKKQENIFDIFVPIQ